MTKIKKNDPDWDRIEADYRAGIKTLREIAGEHSLTEGAIRKRAKRDGWERDLAEKVRAKAKSLVRKEQVRNEVRKETATEREVIEIEAQVQARIELTHRKDITNARTLAVRLLEELEDQTLNRYLYEQLGELLNSPDEKGLDRLNEMYRKVISMGGRVTNMKQLADTLKTLVELERRVYGIDQRTGMDGGIEALLKQLDG